MKGKFSLIILFIFFFHSISLFAEFNIAQTLRADDILDQTLFAKNESGYEWIIGLQLNRKDTHFKGRIYKVVYEIMVINDGHEIERTNLFTLDLGDYKLENANGHFTSSQLYKLKYMATKYYERLEFKLAFREIYFDTGEIAKFNEQGIYTGS